MAGERQFGLLTDRSRDGAYCTQLPSRGRFVPRTPQRLAASPLCNSLRKNPVRLPRSLVTVRGNDVRLRGNGVQLGGNVVRLRWNDVRLRWDDVCLGWNDVRLRWNAIWLPTGLIFNHLRKNCLLQPIPHLTVSRQKAFNAKTPRCKGAKVLETLTGRLGCHRWVSASCRPPPFGFRCVHFASWPLCALALNSD